MTEERDMEDVMPKREEVSIGSQSRENRVKKRKDEKGMFIMTI
jgi:hypothetical protein